MVADEVVSKYEMTIGIECHVQLATRTKLFSGADNDARGKEPNSVVSPIDYGLPGMLPVLNRQAIDLAVKAAKAMNAEVATISRFDRKHYFYPDLPSGYQITQMYHPTILAGWIEAPLDDGTGIKVRINHAHIETDAGKLTHYNEYSLVDYNRAGTPLIEIVSEPDMHTPAQARAYATELYRLMTYAGVTHGDLYHGNMRFDVNLSVALKGSDTLGTRTETKNLNSFRSVEKAAEYEFRRQIALIEQGERIIQETRGWDEAKQQTTSQRSKEDAQDYRYMPDPDIPPIILTPEEIEAIQVTVPLLPPAYRDKWLVMQLDRSVTESLLASQQFAALVTLVQEQAGNGIGKKVAHWFASALGRSEGEPVPVKAELTPEPFIELATMVEANELSSTAAKDVFVTLLTSDQSARHIAQSKNLLQVSDEAAIAALVDEVLRDPASQKSIEDVRAGKDKAIGYLVGQIMKKSAGKANPGLAQKLIKERL